MNIEKRIYKVELITPMLGTVPKDPEVYATYITEKAKAIHPEKTDQINSEVEDIEKVEEKGWTGFLADDKGIYMSDHMVKGFLKSAIQTLIENKAIKKIPAYKTWINKMVFVFPRKIRFDVYAPNGVIERPLRAMTAQGPRISLSRSDYVAEGCKLKFVIHLFKNSKGLTWDVIDQAFEYGQYVGFGQYRGSGGYGRFKVI